MKRAPYTQSSISDDSAQSSDGSHYAGNASKRTRIIQQQSRSELTEKVDLLFADGDKMHPRLRQQLVIDNRPSLTSHELKMLVKKSDADIVVAADCDPLDLNDSQNISTEDTTWQVWCNPDSWKLSQLKIFDLIPGERHAVWITVQRSTSCGERLNVVAMKTLKDVADNPFFFSPKQHQQVANEIFKLLSLATCPMVVLGNIGFALNNIGKHLVEYEKVTKSDLALELQIMTTDDQVLMSLFRDSTRPITGAESILIEAILPDQPRRIMIIRLAPAPCLEAEESPWKRRAVIPSTIMDVAKLHFFDVQAVLSCLQKWIHYEDIALCSLRTCNRTLMKFVATVNSSSKNFIKACQMQMHSHIHCPRPIRDWTVLTPLCSSPFCRGETGVWVPCRGHNLPRPLLKHLPRTSLTGSQSIQRWVTEHSEPYVVCSVPCYARVKHLLKLLGRRSNGLVVAVTYNVPAIYEYAW